VADIGFEVQGSGLAATRNHIKVNREVVEAVLKAYVEGNYFVFTDKAVIMKISPDTCARTIRMCSSIPTNTIRKERRRSHVSGLRDRTLINMSAPQLGQAKTVKPEQFVDLSFLQELETMRFFKGI
jgi:hypothetical protein